MTRVRTDVSERTPTLWDLVRAPDARSVVLGVSKDENPKVTVLLFKGEARSPTRAVKAPFTDAAAEAIAKEREVLLHVARALADSPLKATVPRVLGSSPFEGREALICSVVPGVPMATSYHRWRHSSTPSAVEEDFGAAASWLAEFQRVTAAEERAVSLGRGLSARVKDRFGDQRAADGVKKLTQVFAARSAPRVAVHGDFWFGNLFTLGGSVTGVVDWEAGSSSGEPLLDLVRFPLSYALYLDRHTRPGRPVRGHRGLRASWGEGIRYAMTAEGWFPALFRSFIVQGLKRLALPEDLWRDAALLGIAEMAVTSDHERFAERHLGLFVRLLEARA